MQLPQIQMTSQFAKIQIQQTPAKLEMEQRLPEMKIDQPPAELKITTTPSRLTIDQTQAWEDMNLMSIIKRNERFAKEGLQAVKNGIARVAREGKELMEIENGGNVIASQASRSRMHPMKQLGIDFIPSHFSVRTDYVPSEVNIDVTRNEPFIDALIYKPTFTYYPGNVETKILQENDLHISLAE